MTPRKTDLPRFLRENRIGCFVIAAVIAVFLAAAAYIGLSATTENELNSVIPTLR
jgi:hypothetical protein